METIGGTTVHPPKAWLHAPFCAKCDTISFSSTPNFLNSSSCSLIINFKMLLNYEFWEETLNNFEYPLAKILVVALWCCFERVPGFENKKYASNKVGQATWLFGVACHAKGHHCIFLFDHVLKKSKQNVSSCHVTFSAWQLITFLDLAIKCYCKTRNKQPKPYSSLLQLNNIWQIKSCPLNPIFFFLDLDYCHVKFPPLSL